MISNYTFADTTEALPLLLSDVNAAPEIGSRAGKTRELRHVGITLTDPLSREILVPGRRVNLAAQIAETAWVLAGRNDIEWLSHYLPRARDFSDDGETWRSGYGPRLRRWSTNRGQLDQLAYVVDALRKDLETRQAVITLWDPPVDELDGKDRACNNWLHFLARDGVLDLHVAIRSNDLMWGWSGINAFEWSVLLEVVAGLTGLRVGSLHFSTSSLHLYERHWDRAAAIVEETAKTERVTTEPSPRFTPNHPANPLLDVVGFDALLQRWFSLEYDIRTGSPLVSGYIDSFPEPMLRSWLRVLDWWWNGKGGLETSSMALGVAAQMGVKPPWAQGQVLVKGEMASVKWPEPGLDGQVKVWRNGEEVWEWPNLSPFLRYAIKTHIEKDAAYGDSWKRRGEMLGIMANIARKIDRLGGSATADETSADTAMDLMIYLAKYRTWLDDGSTTDGLHSSDYPDGANALLVDVEQELDYKDGLPYTRYPEITEEFLRDSFDRLEQQVLTNHETRYERVDIMLRHAYKLARYLFEQSDTYPGADHD